MTSIIKNRHLKSEKKCYDVDECVQNLHLCLSNERCLNTAGSYECGCAIGYERIGTECIERVSILTIKV